MIIPVGHDSGQLRRRPYVTYAIATACIVVFLQTGGLGDPAMDRAEQQMAEAYAYWETHPYLEPSPRLVAAFGDPGAEARAEFRREIESGESAISSSILAREQSELDRLAARADLTLRSHPWYEYGLVPVRPEPAGAFGHMFLHGGWAHLIGNLLFLLLTGPFIEDRWGRVAFLLFYLSAGLAGAGLYVFHFPEFDGPLIGASGAIAGAMGAFLVRWGTSNIRFVYWLGLFMGSFKAPAWLMLPLWFANELITASLMTSLASGGGGGVAYWAHVGGFGFGCVVALAVRASGLEKRMNRGLGEWSAADASHPALAAARRAVAEGRLDDAFSGVRMELDESPGDPQLPHALLETARATERVPEALAALSGGLARMIEENHREASLASWHALGDDTDGVVLSGPSAVRMAGWLRSTGEPRAAAAALRTAIADAAPAQAVSIARAARKLDPVVALRAAERALGGPLPDPDDARAMAALRDEARKRLEGQGVVVVPDARSGSVANASAARSDSAARPPAPAEAADPGAIDPLTLGDDALPSPEPALGSEGGWADRAIEIPDVEDTLDWVTPDAAGADVAVERSDFAMDGAELGLPDALELGEEGGEPLAPASDEPPGPDAEALGFQADDSLELGDAEDDLSGLDDDAFVASLHAALADGEDGVPPEPVSASEDAVPPEPVSASEDAVPPEPVSASEDAVPPEPVSASEVRAPELAPMPIGPSSPGDVDGPRALPALEPAVHASPEPSLLDEKPEPQAEPRALRVMEGRPKALRDGHLHLELSARGRSRLPIDRIEAVSVVGVKGIGRPGAEEKAVLLIDLVLAAGREDGPVTVLRLRSDRFDPRRLVDGEESSPLKALRRFASQLAQAARAQALPAGRESDTPFRIFASLAAYEREVLGAPDA